MKHNLLKTILLVVLAIPIANGFVHLGEMLNRNKIKICEKICCKSIDKI